MKNVQPNQALYSNYSNFNQQNRQMAQQQTIGSGAGIIVHNQEPLTTQMLAAATPQVKICKID